ncbi:MAG: glycosyltransferase family 2 protein [bacterium]
MSYDILNSESMLRYIPQCFEKDLTIMIPCYNEEGNIIGTFDTLIPVLCKMPFSWEIIVIDDASHDNSKELIRGYINSHPHYCISLKVREKNAGLAQNYYDGAFLARGKYYRLICADNTEPKETLEKIFSLFGKADLIIPYHVKAEGRTFFRKTLSKTYTILVNLIGGHKIKYYNGCALGLTYLVKRWHTGYNGFCFQADIVTRAIEQGFSYLEIPVIAQERKSGISRALRLRNFLSVAHFFLDLVIRRVNRICFD